MAADAGAGVYDVGSRVCPARGLKVLVPAAPRKEDAVAKPEPLTPSLAPLLGSTCCG